MEGSNAAQSLQSFGVKERTDRIEETEAVSCLKASCLRSKCMYHWTYHCCFPLPITADAFMLSFEECASWLYVTVNPICPQQCFALLRGETWFTEHQFFIIFVYKDISEFVEMLKCHTVFSSTPPLFCLWNIYYWTPHSLTHKQSCPVFIKIFKWTLPQLHNCITLVVSLIVLGKSIFWPPRVELRVATARAAVSGILEQTLGDWRWRHHIVHIQSGSSF